MSTPVLQRIDLYDDFPYAAGAVRLRPLMDVEHWELDEFLDGLLWRKRGTVVIPRDETIVEEQVLVFVFKDILGVFSTKQLRINGVEFRVSDGTMLLSGEGPERDLARRDQVIGELVGLTWNLAKMDASKSVATCITDTVLPRLPAYWEVGTVTPTTLVTVQYQAGDTPSAAVLRQVEAVNKATGIQYEVSVTADDVSGKFEVNVTQVGVTAPTILALPNRSILDFLQRQQADGHATRFAPVGRNGATIGRNVWKVVAVQTSIPDWVELEDIEGGPGPAWEADQWLLPTACRLRRANGTFETITDVIVISVQRTRFYVADAANFTVNDRVKIVADGTGTEVLYVESPSAQATYGKIMLPLTLDDDDTDNLFSPNAGFDVWGTPPPGWTVTAGGGVYVEETGAGNWLFGGRSLKLTVSTMTPYKEVVIQVPTGGMYYWFSVWTSVLTNNGLGASQFHAKVDGADIVGSPIELGPFVNQGHQRHNIGGFIGAGSHTFRAEIKLGDVVYLSGAQLTEGTALREFSKGSGATRMIQAANARFRAGAGLPVETIEVTYADLARLDPRNFINLQLRDGCQFRLRYPALNFDRTMRVLRRRTRSEAPGEPAITLQNRPGTFSDFYAVR